MMQKKGMNLLRFKNFIKDLCDDYTDEELVEHFFIIKGRNDWCYPCKSLQFESGDFILTFDNVPYSVPDLEFKNGSSPFREIYNNDVGFEAFMISEAYDCLSDFNEFIELLNVNLKVIGRFSLHDDLIIFESDLIICKDSDVNIDKCMYFVDLSSIYIIRFPNRLYMGL